MARFHLKDSGRTAGPNGTQSCAHPACSKEGLHRAPRSRQALDRYYWFCLEHVREYNRAWDYCAGMTPEEIEAHIRADVVGWRPTWPMGWWASRRADALFDTAADGFGFFSAEEGRRARAGNGKTKPAAARTAEEKALSAMDLSPPVTLERLKARYKELVKRLHPDANGGDQAAEERLKSVNQAYATLKNSVGS
ncbi:MAG: J domain-containing protein [Alphaproteobacteria bacterium]